jgi:ABC-type molybdate transport system substrate-binding protein
MELKRKELAGPRFWLASLGALSIGVVFVTSARAVVVEIFHADSLAGPMRELKKAVEGKNMDVTINLAAGVSKQLAERILNGDACDVFAPSSPAVVDEDLMIRTVAGSDRDAASWYVVFAGNEIVIVTARGTPLGIRHASDLAKPCRTQIEPRKTDQVMRTKEQVL